jgi:hypothetical protein
LTKAVDVLIAGLIDYAGLFPPAGEDMRTALEHYASYVKGPDSRALGRFIVPIARLTELEEAAADLMPKGNAARPWRLSALVADDIASAVKEMSRFNRDHASRSKGRAIVDVVEMKATTRDQIHRQHHDLPPEFTAYFEIPLSGDMQSLVTAMAELHVRAKVRTGGVSANAFPPADKLADFIAACAHARVPFKATAGLHHPLRGEQRLTYEPDSEREVMYGFLNVFLASAMAYAGEIEDTIVAVLQETDPSAFVFGDSGIRWRNKTVTTEQIAAARSKFAIAFGSCSFREPVDELASLTRN